LPPTTRIRPAGTNHPTEAGVSGSDAILKLLDTAAPEDVALCLLSGGGSALLPAPVEGITLTDKQQITRLLHACGATIDEMNCVRKHLSRLKGGRLARAFLRCGRCLTSLIISDVIGDPLDVIASGPTAADPTTFADALAILDHHQLRGQTPAAVLDYLERGKRGEFPETLKSLPPGVCNRVLGNNALALAAAEQRARQLGYAVCNLGSFVEGETSQVAVVLAGLIRSVRVNGWPAPSPLCILSGGETTVTLPADHGRGGRNQELVLALAAKLGSAGLKGVVVLSGGTDGEDGPTDAAGALADRETCRRAAALGLNPALFLARHDAYSFFDATGDLLRTGLTGTNVMDVRVFLITS
jgi:hydroxypyruvate reductase/glycerate 2-kinase